MQNYLQLILLSLFIAFLALYIGSISMVDSFNLPIIKTLHRQISQQEEQRNMAKDILERQKLLFEYRQQQFRETMRTQKQKTNDTMRILKEKLQNARYR